MIPFHAVTMNTKLKAFSRPHRASWCITLLGALAWPTAQAQPVPAAEFLRQGSLTPQTGGPDASVPDDAPRRAWVWPDPLADVQATGPFRLALEATPAADWRQWMALARRGAWPELIKALDAPAGKGLVLDTPDTDHATLLTLAAHAGQADVVKALLKAGARPDWPGLEGHRALALAAREGHTPVMQTLLQAGADVNAQGAHGQQAVHLAAARGQVRALQKLKAEGANLRAHNEAGRTPLSEAALWGQIETLQWLVSAGVPADEPDQHGLNALHAAAVGGQWGAVQWLKARGVPVPSRVSQVLLDQADTRPPGL
ncbi:MAG: hypothetical protein RLZZ182_2616 [Pseudomonadota bacterium]